MENNNEILKKIQTGERELLAEAIKEIQENGDLSIAQIILDNLPHIPDIHTRTTLIHLLADIKATAFREILIKQIHRSSDPQIKAELLRIVWESSLDYSAYLPVFEEILQNEEFTVAFEASTVIENMVHHLQPEQQRQLRQFIESFPENKQFLVENLHTETDCCE